MIKGLMMIDLSDFKESIYLQQGPRASIDKEDIYEVIDRAIDLESKLCKLNGEYESLKRHSDRLADSNEILISERDELKAKIAEMESKENYCALKNISDSQVSKVCRAFWRRIYAYKDDYGIELPHPLPTEFMAHMATALSWVDDVNVNLSAPAQRITEQDLRNIIKSYMEICIPFKVSFESWMSAEGEVLLAKLNEHREQEVKQGVSVDSENIVTKVLCASRSFDEFKSLVTHKLDEDSGIITFYIDGQETQAWSIDDTSGADEVFQDYLKILRIGWIYGQKVTVNKAEAPELPKVEGDVLPPIGEDVFIHLASRNEWVKHKVVGYYAWKDLKGQDHLHRVFVRVVDSDGILNARLLSDVRWLPLPPLKDGE